MSEKEVPSSVQQRIIIKFLNAENVTPTEIYERLLAQFGEECLSRARVFSWCKEFRDGRDRVENEPHFRRASTSLTPENKRRVESRRVSVREISEELEISVGSVEETIHKELNFNKVRSRWVPRLLKPDQLEKPKPGKPIPQADFLSRHAFSEDAPTEVYTLLTLTSGSKSTDSGNETLLRLNSCCHEKWMV